jgi:UDP-sugar transporter A1/2/3
MELLAARNVALTCLIMQNAGLILVMKHSFRSDAVPYSESSAVLASEILKLSACLTLELFSVESNLGKLTKSLSPSSSNIFMIVPATLYVLQNLLQLNAISGLSPAAFVTGAQLKVVTSAIFSTILLKRKLSFTQVLSIFPLMAGVAMVQMKAGSQSSSSQNHIFMLCLLGAVTLSGLSGALLELSFKMERESIWAKNFFLSVFSLPTAAFAVTRDVHSKGKELSFVSVTEGFDEVVVLMISLLALGGLLTALVMKHAGALTKCFAVSVSIIICTGVTVFQGLQPLTLTNFTGVILVTSSVFLYSSASKKKC